MVGAGRSAERWDPVTALHPLPEEQLLQGCRLPQATLTNRLLILAVTFKKFHPCCIPGYLKALMFHQPQRDPPASKGSFPLGDSRTVLFSKASSQHNALHTGRAIVSPLSLLLHLLNSTLCFPVVPVHPILLFPLMPPVPLAPCGAPRHRCFSSSACPPCTKAFESLKDGEGGSILRPSPFCTASNTCLGVPWQPLGCCRCSGHSPAWGTCSVPVSHLIFSLGCATASCFFFL